MKFEVDCGDGSRRTFSSADEVDDFRRWHKDDYGGIEAIRVSSDSGNESTWAHNVDSITWAREKEREYSEYDRDYARELSSQSSDNDSDDYSSSVPDGVSVRPMSTGEWYAFMLGMVFILVVISSQVTFIIGEMISFVASIILFIVLVRGIIDFFSWLFDQF